jgi:hypothetical protein
MAISSVRHFVDQAERAYHGPDPRTHPDARLDRDRFHSEATRMSASGRNLRASRRPSPDLRTPPDRLLKNYYLDPTLLLVSRNCHATFNVHTIPGLFHSPRRSGARAQEVVGVVRIASSFACSAGANAFCSEGVISSSNKNRGGAKSAPCLGAGTRDALARTSSAAHTRSIRLWSSVIEMVCGGR